MKTHPTLVEAMNVLFQASNAIHTISMSKGVPAETAEFLRKYVHALSGMAIEINRELEPIRPNP
jgi:hypothetical protein